MAGVGGPSKAGTRAGCMPARYPPGVSGQATLPPKGVRSEVWVMTRMAAQREHPGEHAPQVAQVRSGPALVNGKAHIAPRVMFLLFQLPAGPVCDVFSRDTQGAEL